MNLWMLPHTNMVCQFFKVWHCLSKWQHSTLLWMQIIKIWEKQCRNWMLIRILLIIICAKQKCTKRCLSHWQTTNGITIFYFLELKSYLRWVISCHVLDIIFSQLRLDRTQIYSLSCSIQIYKQYFITH